MADDRQRLQDFLLQQLKVGVPYTELRHVLMYTPHRSELAMAAGLFASSQYKNLLKMDDHIAELSQLEQQLAAKDRAQAIQSIKNSPLFHAAWQNDDGSLSEFSLKSMLLTAAGDDPTLLNIALDGISLSPSDYSLSLYHLSAATLQQLLQKSSGLSNFQREGMNLADFAVLFLRADLLPVLEEFQLRPSLQPGLYSALDLAFTAPEWPAKTIGQKALGDRRKTIEYLQRKGYPLHGQQGVDAEGRPFLIIDSIWNFAGGENGPLYQPLLLELAAAQQLEKVQPMQPNAELQQMLQPLEDKARVYKQTNENCARQNQLKLQSEGLWSEAKIRQEVSRVEQISGELSAAATILHQRDPGLVTRLWPKGFSIELPEFKAEDQAEIVRQIQINVDPFRATIALGRLQQQPALAVYWQPKAVLHLNFLQKQNDTATLWRELSKHGFSLHLQDIYGRNLYPQAFAAGPDAVALLLEENVAVDQPAVGPDALDLALDQSYLDKKLHPAVVNMMQKMGKPEASHLSRLRRLQQYQPAVFTALQQALAKEPLLLGWLDDLSSYEANPVLAVANE
ncbi:hypothetical protein [Rheinheimera texasensis]|uniref:hypothetical protein n=1 Tax=Rheinheimera texasensis TaxID=306205 RepID=UPI0012FEC18D|nr:hypothetical protein [Rheinheimera texasensis]